MAARTSFNKNDWGGLKKICLKPLYRGNGNWMITSQKLEELGIHAVMEDIQKIHTVYAILKALDDNSTIDLSEIRSFENK